MAGRKGPTKPKPTAKAPPAAKKKPARREKRQPENGINWDAIHAEYIASETSCRALAEKYKISANVISKKATKEHWKNDRQKAKEKVAKKLTTRAARAREESAMKGIDLAKYITDLWTDNLKTLNQLIQESPEEMLKNPAFASSLPRGVRETYDLIMEINGKGYMDRKLANEEKKLKLERERFELEKTKWEEEKKRREDLESMAAGQTQEAWQIEEDDEEVIVGG